MEDSCCRGILSSVENVDIDRVKPKKSAEDLSGYVWHNPEQDLEERRKHTDQRRNELLLMLYQDGITTEQAECLVREWIALVVERDRLCRELLDKENIREKTSYLRDLKHLLRAHPPFGDGSDEVNIRDTLLTLESHVTNYCTRHNITSPGNPMAGSKQVGPSTLQVKGHSPDPDNITTPNSIQPVNLDLETGQTGIPGILQSRQNSTQQSLVDETDGPAKSSNQISPSTPHPPIPTKPQNLRQKFSKNDASPRSISDKPKSSTSGTSVAKEYVPQQSGQNNKTPQQVHKISTKTNTSRKETKSDKSESNLSNDSTKSATMEKCSSNSEAMCTGSSPVTSSQLTPPPPPPLPSILTLRKSPSCGAVGTGQFVGPHHITPIIQLNGEGEPLDNGVTNEPQDPSLELPSSEDRKFLMNEISSIGQTLLRRTNRDRSPGGTPARVTKNRLTLTGNTDMFQRALISKFRSFHSTPIKKTCANEKGDSLDVSSAWSDVNGSMVFDDPDITTTSSSYLGNCSSRAKISDCDPNTSTAV